MLNDSLKGKKILITGGSGFIGKHLLPLLLETGANVFCLVRSPESAKRLPKGTTPILGDCTNFSQMQTALENCQILIHMAGTLFGSSWQSYLNTNSSMAGNIAQANALSHLEKIIFISSLAAAGPCAVMPGIDEAVTPKPVSAYGWSKLLAEYILKAKIQAQDTKPKLIILRPSIVYGSGDLGMLPLFKSCKLGIGISPGLRNFPVSLIHAADTANAIMLSLKNENANGIYHLSDGNKYLMEEVCHAIGKTFGRKYTLVLKPPLPIMTGAAYLTEFAHNISKIFRKLARLSAPKPPQFNTDKLREAAQTGWLANNAKIVKELGFKPQYDLHKGMTEAVAGYKQMGIL